MEHFIGIINYIVFFAITAGTYGVLSLGLNIQWGYTGLINFGIAGFYAVGAYTSALLSGPLPSAWDLRTFGGFELPFIVGLLGAAVVSGLLALLIGTLTLRLKADYLAIATIGIAETIRLILKNESWLTNSVWGLKGIPSPLYNPIQHGIGAFLKGHPNLPLWLHDLIFKGYDWFYLLLILAVLALLYFIIERIIRSPWGRVLKAVREDEVATEMSGKSTFKFKMQSLVLGAMIMGIGGSLYAHYARFVSPLSFRPLYGTFIIWVMLILGGSGNNKGAILGGFIVWGLWAGTDFLTVYLPFSATQSAALRVVAIGALLILVLLFRPQGLLSEEKRVSTILKE